LCLALNDSRVRNSLTGFSGGGDFQSQRNLLVKGVGLQSVREELVFSSGHGFSRAISSTNQCGFSRGGHFLSSHQNLCLSRELETTPGEKTAVRRVALAIIKMAGELDDRWLALRLP
jgi:hypothetical protein